MTTPKSSREVRQSFLDFFAAKGHEIVPSAPVVPQADPTILFTNAGMNQFKEIFLGTRDSVYKRVADTQKCIRVSGKHNDLEEVGRSPSHHTFFEMLGNWSFGDYYKTEAIAWAWELLTEVWMLPKDRLWATVYRTDDEAMELWREVTDIDPSHVIRFDEKDNFWEMGETGPCGPCSEIHIDLTDEGCGPELVNSDDPRCVELWNLVFIQYNRRSDRSLEELPSKHVDTGMGLERIVSVLQGVDSNYQTDLFRPVIDALCERSGRAFTGDDAVAMQVAADHLRALSFAIADGVLPSNEGRGYVLRRLLRRAARFGRTLGLEEPFLVSLFPALKSVMGEAFPELLEHETEICRALQAEEDSFAGTLDRGIELFEQVASAVRAGDETRFPAAEAFKLYDTYGFPRDLTTLMASEQGMEIDEAEVDALMARQREQARQGRKDLGDAGDHDLIADLVARGIKSSFTGYDGLEGETEVLVAMAEGEFVDALEAGQEGQLVLLDTPFYAESGGQLGDTGRVRGGASEFEVVDTQRPAEGLIIHLGRVASGRVAVGDTVHATVDGDRRAQLARHHSATHLLQHALRQVVSASIRQAGSMVAPDRLRFDFNYHSAISPDALDEVERRVNGWVAADDPVVTREMPYKDIQGTGIIAVFDEKYGDVVRVVDIGGYSRELCGGTHVSATGRVGFFRIVGESSIAAGVRRVEAVCGGAACEQAIADRGLLRRLGNSLSAAPDELVDRVDALRAENRRLKKELREREASAATADVDRLLEATRDVDGVPMVVADLGEKSPEVMKSVMDHLREKGAPGVIVLGSRHSGKACFMANVSEELVGRGVHAGKLIGAVARVAGGGGGGQPGRAQAGGKDAGKVGEALEAAPEALRQLAGAN